MLSTRQTITLFLIIGLASTEGRVHGARSLKAMEKYGPTPTPTPTPCPTTKAPEVAADEDAPTPCPTTKAPEAAADEVAPTPCPTTKAPEVAAAEAGETPCPEGDDKKDMAKGDGYGKNGTENAAAGENTDGNKYGKENKKDKEGKYGKEDKKDKEGKYGKEDKNGKHYANFQSGASTLSSGLACVLAAQVFFFML